MIVAAGAWSSQVLGEVLGPELRIHPVRGQMLSFQVPERLFLEMPIHAEDVYLVPRAPGRVLVGATVETVGFDRNLSGEGIEFLLRGAFETVPDLRSCGIDKLWCGFRPGSPDGWPLLGPTPVPGLHLACGHFRRGILLLPLTVKAVAQGLLSGALPKEAQVFSLSRLRA
jgi:glycine oxidase